MSAKCINVNVNVITELNFCKDAKPDGKEKGTGTVLSSRSTYKKHVITAALTHLNKLSKVATVKVFYTNL